MGASCFLSFRSSLQSFLSASAAMECQVELWALRLPGRESRVQEPPAASLEQLDIGALVASLSSDLQLSSCNIPPRYMLFGVSMGALVAHQICKEIVARALPLPIHCILCAAACPSFNSAHHIDQVRQTF